MKPIFVITGIVVTTLTIILYYLVVNELVDVRLIYLMPILWIAMIFIFLRLWKMTWLKLWLLLHVLAFAAGLFGVFLYQAYKKLDESRSFESANSEEVGSLVFNAGNVLYPAINVGILLLFFDAIYLFRRRLKR